MTLKIFVENKPHPQTAAALLMYGTYKLSDLDKAVEIANEVCSYYGITLADLKLKCRAILFVKARAMCYTFIRQKTNLSLSQIGGVFGGLHHTSIIHGLRILKEQRSLKIETNWHKEYKEIAMLIY